jgi:hypothetical protein
VKGHIKSYREWRVLCVTSHRWNCLTCSRWIYLLLKYYSKRRQTEFFSNYFPQCTYLHGGARWRSWLRHCATNRNVAGSIPDGVIGINHRFGPEVDLASNRNEYQEYFLGGKGGRCIGLTTLPPSCADCLQIWEPQPPGPLMACLGL